MCEHRRGSREQGAGYIGGGRTTIVVNFRPGDTYTASRDRSFSSFPCLRVDVSCAGARVPSAILIFGPPHKRNGNSRDDVETSSAHQVRCRLSLPRSRRGREPRRQFAPSFALTRREPGFRFWIAPDAHPRDRARAPCVALATASLRISRSSAKVRWRSPGPLKPARRRRSRC